MTDTDPKEIEDRILHYAEHDSLMPWTLVKRVSEDTGADSEIVRSKMKEMVMNWDLQIRSGGKMDIDRHG